MGIPIHVSTYDFILSFSALNYELGTKNDPREFLFDLVNQFVLTIRDYFNFNIHRRMICEQCKNERQMNPEWQVLMTVSGQHKNVQESIEEYLADTHLPKEVCSSCSSTGCVVQKVHEQIGDLLCIHLVNPGFMPLQQVVQMKEMQFFFLG